MNQITDTILMVRPASFGFNPETAANNAFQNEATSEDLSDIKVQALREFDDMVTAIRAQGIQVIVVEDSREPEKPDAVFPNNWFSTHENGVLITYPMFAPLRRLERREEIIDQIREQHIIAKHNRLEDHEEEGSILEGTGSLLLDRIHRIAYACKSPRTSQDLFFEFCTQYNFDPVLFDAEDLNGEPIYHTNVMMTLGNSFCILTTEAIKSKRQRKQILRRLTDSAKEIVEISLDQMYEFAGNMLQVKNTAGQSFLICSEQAYRSLSLDQIKTLERHSTFLPVPIYTIEKYGGGSARCMVAEIFLKRK